MNQLLNDNEIPVYALFYENGSSPIFLTCDHASNQIPIRLGDLGTTEEIRNSHLGWDIGALDIACDLAGLLDAPLVASRFSRLVIDCNRPPLSAGSIPTRIHGEDIPGNTRLTEREVAQRINEVFTPYHHAINRLLHSHILQKRHVVLLSVHSYTPTLGDVHRPWPIGITYESASRFSDHLIGELSNCLLNPIGINEPYPITPDGDYGMYAHGKANNIDSVLLEIRQDYLQDPTQRRMILESLHSALSTYAQAVSA
jgi:predicted N-formylglutamate amidohydrolase